MARKLIGVLAFGLALAAPSAASAQFGQAGSDQRYVPGEAIVRFEPGASAAERRDARTDAGVSFEQSLGLRRAQVVAFDGAVRSAVARLEDQPGVAYAQPNYRYHALAPPPNDTFFQAGNQWGLSGFPSSVDVLPAWDRSRGAGQVIAIIDTGVDLTHPDLAGNLWTGPGGIHGMDFVDGDTDPDDFNLHGTHVAGIAAAIAENGMGVAGVAPQAQIMAVRVLDGDGSGTTDAIVDGINFAAANGASVINMSLGGPPDAGDTAMANAISAAGNVVVVAAAGNEDEDNDEVPTTPCTFGNANLLCVASVTRTGARSSFSNFGRTTVDLGAPGGDLSGDPMRDVVSTKPFWNEPLLFDDFQTGLDGWTASHASGLDWGLAGSGIGGESVTDSPGTNYLANTDSALEHTPIDLAGERGCRLEYFVRLEGVADPDSVGVGVFPPVGDEGIGQDLAGDTSGEFELFEQSISPLDGEEVTPTFLFRSNGSVQGDGAYVDNFSLLCRGDGPYGDDIQADDAASRGADTAIAGTSMAAPHAAGAAALVRAVDPGAPATQVVEALRQGARPDFGMAGVTVTGGVVDASGAMDAALAMPNDVPPPPPPPPPAATPPNRPRFGKARVSRRGVVSIVVRSDAATTGVLTLFANITAARVRRVGRKAFRVGATRRTTVRVRLGRRARRQLKRRHTMRLRVRAVVRNGAGLTSSRTARIRIRLPRPR